MQPPPGVTLPPTPTALNAALIANSNLNLLNTPYNRPRGSEREDFHVSKEN